MSNENLNDDKNHLKLVEPVQPPVEFEWADNQMRTRVPFYEPINKRWLTLSIHKDDHGFHDRSVPWLEEGNGIEVRVVGPCVQVRLDPDIGWEPELPIGFFAATDTEE